MFRLGGTVAGACGILAMYWPRSLSNDLPEVNLFVGCVTFIGAWIISFQRSSEPRGITVRQFIEYVTPPRVVDIVPLFCRYCPARVGAVSRQDFDKILKGGITLCCEPCRRRVEAEEYRKTGHQTTKR
jgi:hypothetical protein